MASMYDGMIGVREVAAKYGRSVPWVWKQVQMERIPQPAWRRRRDTKWYEALVDESVEARKQALLESPVLPQ